MRFAPSHLRWSIAYWISRLGAAVGRFLPTSFWYALAVPIAGVCWLVMARQRRIVTENLVRVVGEREASRASRGVFRNYARYVIDFYQLPSLGRERLCDRIDFNEWPRLDAALSEGKGTIFVTLHLGQAELGAGAFSAYGYSISAICETFNHEGMNAFIQGLRTRLGMKVIPAKRAAPGMLRCLNRGEVLGMMFDAIEPSGGGVFVDFFGAPAEVSAAAARIALRSGARVLPGVVGRGADDPQRLLPMFDFDVRYAATGDEDHDVRALSQAIATAFEAQIRRFADQWLAFHLVWGTGVPAEAAAHPAERASASRGLEAAHEIRSVEAETNAAAAATRR